MRGLLILSAIIAIVIFLMPFILSTAIFFIAIMALLMVLANFGLLPGVVFRRYGRIKNNAPRVGRTRTVPFDEDERGRGEDRAWRADSQEEGEIITLPETALHKESRSGKTRQNQRD
jgi:hypothetical protein